MKMAEILRAPLPWWVVGGVLTVACLTLWMWWSSTLILHPPRLPNQVSPRAYGLTFETVEFPSADGPATAGRVRLKGWFVPGASGSDTTIICLHGFGANRADILDGTLYLRKGGYHLLYFDFREHGDSGAGPASLGVLELQDVAGAVAWLAAAKPAASRRLGIMGYSMGAAVAIAAAAGEPKILAVLADTPFATWDGIVTGVAWHFYHIPRYPFIPLTTLAIRWRLGTDPSSASPLRHIARLSPRPLLLIHGLADRRMPPQNSERLYAAAGEPKSLWLVPGADHIEARRLVPKEYERRVLEFFKAAFH